jgi:hypothetical protein
MNGMSMTLWISAGLITASAVFAVLFRLSAGREADVSEAPEAQSELAA